MRKHLCLCFATNLHLIPTAGIQIDSAYNAGKKVKTPRCIGLANREKGYHRNTYLTWVYGLHPITCYQELP